MARRTPTVLGKRSPRRIPLPAPGRGQGWGCPFRGRLSPRRVPLPAPGRGQGWGCPTMRQKESSGPGSGQLGLDAELDVVLERLGDGAAVLGRLCRLAELVGIAA